MKLDVGAFLAINVPFFATTICSIFDTIVDAIVGSWLTLLLALVDVLLYNSQREEVRT